MGLPLFTRQYEDQGGGLDLKSSPVKEQENQASALLNTDYSTDGSFYTRYGSTIMNVSGGIPAQIAGAPRSLNMFDYHKSDSTEVIVIAAGTSIYEGLTTPTATVTGLSALLPVPDFEFQVTNDDEYLFYGNGLDTNLKFNGTTWTNWSIATPIDPTFNAFAAGNLTAGVYSYYVAFARTVGGTIVQISDLNPISLDVTVPGGPNQSITINIPVSTDAQVNARVLYRLSPTSLGVYLRQGVVVDNVTTTFTDNTLADGTIEAEFENQPAPTSAIFEEYQGRMNIVDANNPTDLYESKANLPWNVPDTNFEIFDGPIQCVKRIYNILLVATDRSLWFRSGTLASGAVSQRLSSKIGILNNRCAVGEGTLYIMATNRKIYALTPTDFSYGELRINEATSINIEPLMQSISVNAGQYVTMEYYTAPNVGKVMISAPVGSNTNNKLIILNETQSQNIGSPCWQLWDNINASAMKQMRVSGVSNLYSGDYNGFLWKLDDPLRNGDGAEINGTATAASVTTLTDTTQTWTVNAYVGMRVRILTGTGANQVSTITANTATQLTFNAMVQAPVAGSTYTVGGYDVYHYTNWKSITGSYDMLKQLWFFLANLNANGDYDIELILQFDFDTTEANQLSYPINLSANNSIWGAVIWGQFVWGAQAVFHDRLRIYARFYSVRFGFRNREAGQPFQVNSFSVSVQDKKLFYGAET